MSRTRIELGDRAKDLLTGFKGIAVSETQWIYGCRRIGIQPEELNKDGVPTPVEYFDEPQVELVEKGALAPIPQDSKASPGGPRNDVRGNRRDPSRH